MARLPEQFKGAKLVGQRRVYEPPTSLQMCFVKAVGLVNRTQADADAWSAVFNKVIGPALVERGESSVDAVVPKGGLDVLLWLGFTASFVRGEGESDVVRVSLTDPARTVKVMQ